MSQEDQNQLSKFGEQKPRPQSQSSPSQPQSVQPQQIIVTHRTGISKSVGIAFLLSFLFGPLGMFYSTVIGGVIMLIISIIVGIFTLGFGLIVTWPVCIIWAVVAATNYNKKAMQQTMATSR